MALPESYQNRGSDAMQRRLAEAKHRQAINRPRDVKTTGNPERDAMMKDMVARRDREVHAEMAGKEQAGPAIRATAQIREAYPALFAKPELAAVMGAMDSIQVFIKDERPHLERYQENANRLQEELERPENADFFALTPPVEVAAALIARSNAQREETGNAPPTRDVLLSMQGQRAHGNPDRGMVQDGSDPRA